MKKNPLLKKITQTHVIVSFLLGAALASAGWYASSKINLSFGLPVEIDEVKEFKGSCKDEGKVKQGGTEKKKLEDGSFTYYTLFYKCVSKNVYYKKAVKVKNNNKDSVKVVDDVARGAAGKILVWKFDHKEAYKKDANYLKCKWKDGKTYNKGSEMDRQEISRTLNQDGDVEIKTLVVECFGGNRVVYRYEEDVKND